MMCLRCDDDEEQCDGFSRDLVGAGERFELTDVVLRLGDLAAPCYCVVEKVILLYHDSVELLPKTFVRTVL